MIKLGLGFATQSDVRETRKVDNAFHLDVLLHGYVTKVSGSVSTAEPAARFVSHVNELLHRQVLRSEVAINREASRDVVTKSSTIISSTPTLTLA